MKWHLHVDDFDLAIVFEYNISYSWSPNKPFIWMSWKTIISLRLSAVHHFCSKISHPPHFFLNSEERRFSSTSNSPRKVDFWRTENSFSKKSDESKTPTQSRPCTTKIDSLSCLADDARKAKITRFFRRVKPRQSVEKKRMILETRSINIIINFDRLVSNTTTRKLSWLRISSIWKILRSSKWTNQLSQFLHISVGHKPEMPESGWKFQPEQPSSDIFRSMVQH